MEELDPHPADALLRELGAWDAWDDVRRDEAADAADLRRALEWADAAEKLAGQGRDVPARHALRRRWEPRAAPVAEPDAPEPCTRVAGQFAELSCAALAVAEPRALPQSELRAERSRKLSEAPE